MTVSSETTEELHNNTSCGIRTMCPTRWTIRADSLRSIIDNYSVLQELWDWSLETITDTDMKARIRGVKHHMLEFDFYWGIHLAACLLRNTDALSKTLQKKDISAAEGHHLVQLTVKVLESMRNEENAMLFWENVMKLKDDLGLNVSEPKLPRK